MNIAHLRVNIEAMKQPTNRLFKINCKFDYLFLKHYTKNPNRQVV